MAGFDSIAGVSTTLRNLLQDRMEDVVDVTIAPPDVTITGMDGRRVNIYLYQVNENGYLKNQEIPGQGHPGDYGRPPLSLELKYLVTAHGSTPDGVDADLQAQQVLGDAMRVFHEYPIINEELHENDNPANPLILDPSLVGEFERIKITLSPNLHEELSKIWTAQPDMAFRLSVIYLVSVVQIESRRRRRSALPVRRRGVYAIPFETPFIAEMYRDPPYGAVRTPVVAAGETLVIVGHNLAGLATQVRVGETLIPIAASQDQRIALTLPGSIAAGTHSVQVIHELPFDAEQGQPPVLHRGFESNVASLVLIPAIQNINPANASAGDTITITLDPPVEAGQEPSLFLGDVEIHGEPVPSGSPPSATAAFQLPTGQGAIAAGNHLLRVRVDGAESRLTSDPVTGAYIGPMFTVNP